MKVFNIVSLVAIIGLTFLSSCSPVGEQNGDIENDVSVEVIVKDQVLKQHIIDTDVVVKWNDIRVHFNTANYVLDTGGNKFSFVKDSLTSVIHAYAGFDTIKRQLIFTLIKSETDTVNNRHCTAIANVNMIKYSLPEIDTTNEINKDTIGRAVAKASVKNWMNDSIRKVWLNQRITNVEIFQPIFQLFVIHTSDFEYGVKHDCYLALKHIDGVYYPDLIILNTKRNKIVGKGSETEANLEDMTAPIPPFKPGHEPENFGLLERLLI
ncbi:MAG: hypothetical protein JKY54_12155 [Flavobacteriales bacterium]|nr:hypothetical protein [Flavobacteriales bacterium]